MKVTIIGLGLIGGSMALALKEKGLASRIIGVDENPLHRKQALELGWVDEINELNDAMHAADLIILAVPVNALGNMIGDILAKADKQVIMDTGSTKQLVCAMAGKSKNRNRFVATHPMWGTEHSGPAAAV